MRKITAAAVLVHPTRTISASPDESDNRFLECAQEAQAGYVVTGNKRHFPFPEFEGINIVSPAEFARMLMEERLRYGGVPKEDRATLSVHLQRCYNPTLTPARYMNGRMVDKIMTCRLLA